MPFFSRKSPRLPSIDYSSGWFFVTICAKDRQPIFGAIRNGNLEYSPVGRIVDEAWQEMRQLPGFTLDAHVLMPNHLHGIVIADGANADNPQLGKVVAQFKSRSSKRAGGPLWQRGYYDHGIRDETDLYRIREYISINPLKWHLDRENDARTGDNDEESTWF